ncbi:MAG: hypothetical protein JNL39_11180 [Opitutaceae bacterium]|nr:hypothetical protein [Opitutaceae bacterium]
MNPAPSSSPRLVCRVVRHWHAAAGGGARHLETCADCRAYFAAAAALDQALRRAAPAWQKAETPAPSTGFEQRLLNAVRTASAPPPARPTHLGWAAATTLAAVVAVALIYPARGPSAKTGEDEAALLAKVVTTASRGLVENVIPSTGALVADNPLQREFGAIYADARSALGFLALNFLPTAAVAENTTAASPL